MAIHTKLQLSLRFSCWKFQLAFCGAIRYPIVEEMQGRICAMKLCTAPKKKAPAVGISVFIDIVFIDR